MPDCKKEAKQKSSKQCPVHQAALPPWQYEKGKVVCFFSRSPTLPQFQLKSMSLSEEIFVCNIGVSLTISIYKTTHSYWYISQELNILLTFVILSVLAKCNTNRIHWTWRVLFNWNIERNEHTSRKHMWNFQHWQNGVIIWPPLSTLLDRSSETETPSKLQVIKTKDKSNLSCLSYFLPGPRPRLAWDNFDKHFTLKSTCCEPKVCFRIWGIFKEHLLYMQTLAHFLIRSLPSSFVLNYIHTNIVSELYMQRLRIPWSLETLCQGPSPKLHNPPFRLLPYSAFCP